MTVNQGSELTPKTGVAADPPGLMARRILRRADRATLATARRDGSGWPYPTLAMVALDRDASPLLLVSTLAEHTRNLLVDARVGLLFDATAGLANPLAGARVTVLGRAHPTAEPRHRHRYLARHPEAALHDGFGDFGYYRVEVEQAHLVAGFGRVHWIDRAELILNCETGLPGGLAEDEAALVRQIDPQWVRALTATLTDVVGASDRDLGAEPWAVTGLDPEGCDVRQGGRVVRFDFDQPVGTAAAALAALARLAGDRHE